MGVRLLLIIEDYVRRISKVSQFAAFKLSLFFDDEGSFHTAMAHPTKNRTLERKRSNLVRGEFHCGGDAFLEFLLNVESLQLDSMIPIAGCDNQPDMIALFHANGVRRKGVLLACHVDVVSL